MKVGAPPQDRVGTSLASSGTVGGAGNLRNYPVSTTAPTTGQVLTWNGTEWAPATPTTLTVIKITSGDVSNPPTESELETLIGYPSNTTGQGFLLNDTSVSYQYIVFSDGLQYQLIPTVRAAGTSGSAPITMTSARAGGWTQVTAPHAIYYNGKTYFGYVNGANGNIEIRSYTNATGVTSSATVMHAALEAADTHDAPSIIVRDSDKRIMAFYTKHDVTNVLYKWVSTNPEDISAGSETSISTIGGTSFTYPNPVQLLGEANDPIYVFLRDEQDAATSGTLVYTKSTDDGSTWSSVTTVYKNNGKQSYWVIYSDGNTRIDVAASDGHPATDTANTVNVYHFYYDGGTWYTTAGASVTPTITPATATQVYSAAVDGNAWPSSIGRTSGGLPVLTYEVVLSGGTDNSYRYALWNGSSWRRNPIVSAGGVFDSIVAPHCHLDWAAVDCVYAAIKVSGTWEIRKYTTLNSGVSWTAQNVTSASASNNYYPAAVRNHAATLKAVWLVGTYTSYLNNNLGISGTAV